ncbi:MAG: protein phosphatase 2C domain-containing protein [Anaerolineales bacterium]|nr:protein phosphatase 2C domain-containing protein [Anaerolineales bacterium]
MINHATLIGRSHRLWQQNGQDFALSGAPAPDCAFGLVLDGCGSKYRSDTAVFPSHNEVGAKLLGKFLASALSHKLQSDTAVSPADLLADLYRQSLDFLAGLVALFPGQNPALRRQLVMTHLLCTVVGFVKVADTAVFFWRGDGFLAVDGSVTGLDSGNQPDYLAYDMLEGRRDGRFHSQPIPPDARWFAAASDGWTADLLTGCATPRPGPALQRWLNQQSQPRGQFEDDGAVAVWWGERAKELS